MSAKERIPLGQSDFGQNPFGGLSTEGLPPGKAPEHPESQPIAPKKKSRGRVDIIRQTAHRGGKTVTVVTGFMGIGLVAGIEVWCLSPETRADCHYGYEPDENDRHNMRLLRHKFHIALKEPYSA